MKSFDPSRPASRRRIFGSQAASTLIEALVAVGLLAIGSATAGKYLVTNVRQAGSNNRYSVGYSLAEKEMENLRSLDYPDIITKTASQLIDNVTYTVGTQVTANLPAANMKTIVVTTSWPENGVTRNVVLNTIYTEITR